MYQETEETWMDILHFDITMPWSMRDLPLLDDGKAFLLTSDKEGWRHFYKMSMDGKKETLLTPGDADIARYYQLDETDGYVYFNASPENSTQRYLYRSPLDGSGTWERLTPEGFSGVNRYDISPNCRYAIHTHSSAQLPEQSFLISLPDHQILDTLKRNDYYRSKVSQLPLSAMEFFQVTTPDSVTLDGWMITPPNFDSNLEYPVFFYVYGEPVGQTATDSWSFRHLWHHLVAQQGYVVISMDNRGTPCLKGREWRKSMYQKVGVVNARDQAMAAREIGKWDFIDSTRMAIWGWSGGANTTLSVMFKYPEVYQTGIAVAPVTNHRFYNSVYQERYMGLPQENPEAYAEGSPLTHARHLEGNLLLVHGTGDDNVHYQNSEALVNELIRHNKQFQFMAYPNRTHGIWEGENTSRHLYTLLLSYLKRHCRPGGRYP